MGSKSKPRRHTRSAAQNTQYRVDFTQATMDLGADYDNRVLYLVGDIEQDTARTFLIGLHIMDREKGPIVVVLNSQGGRESDGYAIYDAIRLARNHITIVAYGSAMSISALIFQAADRRVMSPECRYMMHNGTIHAGTDDEQQLEVDKIVLLAEEARKGNRRYHSLLSHHTGRNRAEIEEFCHRETVFYAEEAVSMGFADEVLRTNKRKDK